MNDMNQRIQDLKNDLEDYSFEENDVTYVVFRLREIRKELVKEDKIFETRNVCKVIGVNENTFINLEKGDRNSNYKNVVKLIHLYSLVGYNPLWILNKENFFIEKRNTDTDLILNKSSVESAVSKFNNQMNLVFEMQQDALDEFKKDIKS